MDIQTLTQKISDNTHIGKNDIQRIIMTAFTILVNNTDEKSTLTIPQCEVSQEINLQITKIQNTSL